MGSSRWRLRVVWVLILLAYLVLVVPTVRRYGVLWDEQVDLEIARSYLSGAGGWFFGSSFDPSQSRLPMYAVALLFALLGTNSLDLARWVSCLLGGVTLLAVYAYCGKVLDRKTGLLACLILATSPYFLSFARVALTESDLFVTCAIAWFLLFLSMLLREMTVRWALATGVVLGLALASKVSAAALLPVALLAPVLLPRSGTGATSPLLESRKLLLAGALLGLLGAGELELWWTGWLKGGGEGGWDPRGGYFLLLAVWAGIVLWLGATRGRRVEGGAAGILVVLVAGVTFMLFPPVHTTNPDFLPGILKRFLRSLHSRASFGSEAAAFHVGCVLFKSSPLVGAGLWAGLVAAVMRWNRRPEVRPVILIVLPYLLFLVRMDIAQTFYMMPLLPMLAILASDQFFQLHRSRRRLAAGLGAAALSLLAVDLIRCYPDFNLNGYQYLGERYLAGRSTLGYRSIAQVTTDGVVQALDWARRNVPRDATVVTFITASHIVRAVCPHPAFRLVNGLARPEEAIREADYVITSLNAEIADDRGLKPQGGGIYRLPYDRAYLEENFRQVFAVERAFGIQFARVLQRRTHRDATGP